MEMADAIVVVAFFALIGFLFWLALRYPRRAPARPGRAG